MSNIDVQFCILEQFFPDGPDHPFAKTMMSHFHKLRAPLFSIHEFPSLAEQEQRFIDAGWAHARARSLWDLWSDDNFLPESTRASLDSFEAFDEWEEFALFASHYFLLVASNNNSAILEKSKTPEEPCGQKTSSHSEKFVLKANCPSGKSARRRYGALVPDSKDSVGHYGGQGERARLASTDLYTREGVVEPANLFPSRDIPVRMCHTITPLGTSSDCLLVGGRASPAAPLGDCWLRQRDSWRRVHPLPVPRFRHAAVSVPLCDADGSVLIYGGKTRDNTILDSWLLWSEKDQQGWQTVEIMGTRPEARFGSCVGKISDNFGVLFGGIGRKGTIIEDFWTWSLSRGDDGSLQVKMTELTGFVRDASPQLFPYLARFGATVTATSFGLVLAGGIMSRQLVPAEKEILLLDSTALLTSATKAYDTTLVSAIGLGTGFTGPKPLLTGHVARVLDTDQVLFLGGGAVCFSFGTFWTEGTWVLQSVNSRKENAWTVVMPKETPSKPPQPPASKSPSKGVGPIQIPRTHVESAAQFQQIVVNGQPVIIEGADIGPCTQLWTKEYLTKTVGEDRKVRQPPALHESAHAG